MTVPALVDDFNPELADRQLVLDDEAFAAIQGLTAAGAITPTALHLDDPNLDFDTALALAKGFGSINRMSQWWIGDLLIFGEGVYGERFAQIADETGLAEQTLLNRMYVCRHVDPKRRRASLSFSVHAEVASLPARSQEAWLKKAEKGGWTRAILRDHMKARRKDEAPPELPSGDDGDVGGLEEVARAILRDAKRHDDGQHHLVPNEDMVRLAAALDEEE